MTPLSIDGNFITYSNGTKQQTGRFQGNDTQSGTSLANFAVGTYFLIDTQDYNSRTSPIPLDGWGRTYSGPALYTSASHWSSMSGYTQPFASSSAVAANVIYSGTWVSRGASLTQAFVVRIA